MFNFAHSRAKGREPKSPIEIVFGGSSSSTTGVGGGHRVLTWARKKNRPDVSDPDAMCRISSGVGLARK
jgi:hypothetical protein